MAISIQAQLAKKLPIPGSQFSSQQASITITAEVTDLNQVVSEAQRLYQLAEQAVDAQLGQSPQPAVPVAGGSSAHHDSQASAPRPTGHGSQSRPQRSSAPYRGPAPVTDSQLRFIKRLIGQSNTSLDAILQHHQIGSLDQLTCKDASALVDELKSRVPA